MNMARKLQDRKICLFSYGPYRKIKKRFIKLYGNLSWKGFIGLKAVTTLLVDRLPAINHKRFLASHSNSL